MLDLLNSYSLSEIIIFIIMLAFAIKGVVDFYDWAKQRIKDPVDKIYNQKEMQKKALDILEFHNKEIKKMSKAINILINSDKDDIKA